MNSISVDSIARKYHQVAMDLYDFGKIYKAKGQPQYYQGNLTLAFLLDKEAAIKIQTENVDLLWKAVYPRSAGALALQCGKYEEAKNLAEIGLKHKAHISDYELEKLQELLDLSTKNLKESTLNPKKKDKTNPILAIASAANIDQYLQIQQISNNKYHLVKISSEDSLQITRSFLGDMVEVEIRTDENGSLILQDIRRAA